MTRGPLAALVLAASLALASATHAATCCYSICGASPVITQVGLLVSCAPDGTQCPRGTGACGVWAQRASIGSCTAQATCNAGTYSGRQAEALLGRLLPDPAFRVVRPVEFQLSNGAWVGFRPTR